LIAYALLGGLLGFSPIGVQDVPTSVCVIEWLKRGFSRV
jgi:hypothetical protein